MLVQFQKSGFCSNESSFSRIICQHLLLLQGIETFAKIVDDVQNRLHLRLIGFDSWIGSCFKEHLNERVEASLAWVSLLECGMMLLDFGKHIINLDKARLQRSDDLLGLLESSNQPNQLVTSLLVLRSALLPLLSELGNAVQVSLLLPVLLICLLLLINKLIILQRHLLLIIGLLLCSPLD